MPCDPANPDSKLYLQDALNALVSEFQGAFGPAGGAATALNQVTGNILLAAIDTKLGLPLPLVIEGLNNVEYGQTEITTTEAAVPAASLANRKTISIKALAANTQPVYIGKTGVSSTNGYELSAGDSVELDCDAGVVFYVIAAAGVQRVCTAEVA